MRAPRIQGLSIGRKPGSVTRTVRIGPEGRLLVDGWYLPTSNWMITDEACVIRNGSTLNHPPAAVPGKWSRHRPGTVYGWVTFIAAAVSWSYACAVGLLFLQAHGKPAQMDWIAQWVAMPVQLLAFALVASLLCGRGLIPARMRGPWWFVLAF